MKYDLRRSDELRKARARFDQLVEKEKVIELKEITARRSLNQNAWMHMLFTFFAIEFGYRTHEAKTHLKRKCPFMRYEYVNEDTGEVEHFLRETRRLDKKECSDFIEWIYNYSAQNGCPLPTLEEYKADKDKFDAIIRSHRQHL